MKVLTRNPRTRNGKKIFDMNMNPISEGVVPPDVGRMVHEDGTSECPECGKFLKDVDRHMERVHG